MPRRRRALTHAYRCRTVELWHTACREARRCVRATGSRLAHTSGTLEQLLARWPALRHDEQDSADEHSDDEHNDSTVRWPTPDDSDELRAFMCRICVHRAACVAAAPCEQRLRLAALLAIAWFGSLAQPLPLDALWCAPFAALVHSMVDAALVDNGPDAQSLLAQLLHVRDTAIDASAAAAAAEHTATLFAALIDARRAPSDETFAAAIAACESTVVSLDQTNDEDVLHELVLALEAARAAVASLDSAAAYRDAVMRCARSAIARGAAVERAAGRSDGRFARLAQRTGSSSASLPTASSGSADNA